MIHGRGVHFIFTPEPLMYSFDLNVTRTHNYKVYLTILEPICIETTAEGRSINFFPKKVYNFQGIKRNLKYPCNVFGMFFLLLLSI